MSENQLPELTEELRARVREIVADVLEVPVAEVGETSSFTEDLDADSLLVIEIFSRFERQLGLRIPQEELADLDNLATAYAVIARHAPQEALRV
ncbi:acyl carrier protein [Allostreptomyces psammosilenae]|uniref:Acyl carrier protein n=1 Tax=Allostreptomyces psammosilenae TaxID=1892865 RepID=A0A852ZNV8_9ACTN|nr:acyl carrier protein [Allostreptomyces psammosilenae]NYI04069.1 acyl carrier protein [Allostreptomyces psammosilenae]